MIVIGLTGEFDAAETMEHAVLTTLPSAVTMGNTAYWKFVFADAELQAQRLQRRAYQRRDRHRPARDAVDVHVHEVAAGRGLVLAGGDTAATLKAAAEKTSGVNAAMAYGTDGPVAALGLLVMEDPKGVQPVYAPAPLVREEVLKRYPAIATILSPIFKSLDRPTLQMLNARIQLEGQDPRKVASAYLHSKGYLK